MTDIVKRLRENPLNLPAGFVGIQYEAADEIERLRLELDMTQATIRVPSQKDDVRTIERLREELVSALDEAARLRKANATLQGAFRVNMLRAFPNMSHEEIDAEIKAALGESGE